MIHHDEPEASADEEMVEVARFDNLATAHEYALIPLALGDACLIDATPDGHDYTLMVEPDRAEKIRAELADYREEQREIARERKLFLHPFFEYDAGYPWIALWAAILSAIFYAQTGDPGLTDDFASSSIGLIEHHQWWRPFTSLFLHADVGHLLGNIGSGLLFISLLSRTVGAKLAWLTTLLCGTLGNALTSFLNYPEPFSSIGASTAVFAALGALTGIGSISFARFRTHLPWVQLVAPLLGGSILLGWLGSGRPGGNTDVLGHVAGFAFGIAAGIFIALLDDSEVTITNP